MATLTDQRGNGAPPTAGDRLRIDPAAARQRRPRMTWIALGLLVTLGFGLFGAVTVARVADRQPVLALAKAIERGDPVTSEHLAVVNVGAEEGASLVEAADRDELVGLTATARLDAGTLVTRELFTTGPSIEPGESVIGLALAPGEYPTSSLRPGDQVVVVRTPDANLPGGADEDAPTVLAEDAEVFAVETLSDTARTLMVSLAVPEAAAPDIASAAAVARVRLVLVAAR